MWSANVSACGQNQTISILGLAELVFDAVDCPVVAGSPVSISLALTVPSLAKGVGPVNVILNAVAANGNDAICLNLTVPLFVVAGVDSGASRGAVSST